MLPHSRSAARTSRCPRARTTPRRWSRLAVKLRAWGGGSPGPRPPTVAGPRGAAARPAVGEAGGGARGLGRCFPGPPSDDGGRAVGSGGLDRVLAHGATVTNQSGAPQGPTSLLRADRDAPW